MKNILIPMRHIKDTDQTRVGRRYTISALSLKALASMAGRAGLQLAVIGCS